jgi:hypothetical protein
MAGDTEACLTGTITDVGDFMICDLIVTVPPKLSMEP